MKVFECNWAGRLWLVLSAAVLILPGCKKSSEISKPTANEVGELYETPVAWNNKLFEPPVRILAGGEPILLEEPGYACPTMADVDGDGRLDLVVGQYDDGKMSFFKNTASDGEEPRLAKGEWIMCGDQAAVVPGVW